MSKPCNWNVISTEPSAFKGLPLAASNGVLKEVACTGRPYLEAKDWDITDVMVPLSTRHCTALRLTFITIYCLAAELEVTLDPTDCPRRDGLAFDAGHRQYCAWRQTMRKWPSLLQNAQAWLTAGQNSTLVCALRPHLPYRCGSVAGVCSICDWSWCGMKLPGRRAALGVAYRPRKVGDPMNCGCWKRVFGPL